jgi:hypothetical protein
VPTIVYIEATRDTKQKGPKMQKPTKENIARAQIIEMEDGTRLWMGEEPEPRRHMDEANGWRVGHYACWLDGGESSNAWAWTGPHQTEEEAVAAELEQALELWVED